MHCILVQWNLDLWILLIAQIKPALSRKSVCVHRLGFTEYKLNFATSNCSRRYLPKNVLMKGYAQHVTLTSHKRTLFDTFFFLRSL